MEVWGWSSSGETCLCYSPHFRGKKKKEYFVLIPKVKKSGKLYTLVACSRVHGVGEKELSPSLLVRVTGEGRAPSPVPLGKTHLVEGEKCSPSVCAPVWSGNFTGLSPVPPQLYKSVLTAPFPPSLGSLPTKCALLCGCIHVLYYAASCRCF